MERMRVMEAGTIRRSRAGCAAPFGRSERGAALLLVMWLGTFFSLVLTGFAFSMRVETDATRNFRDRTETMLLAEAGIHQAVVDLSGGAPAGNATAGPFRPNRIGPRRLGHGTYEVFVTNEDGRISLNHASETVWKKLLQNTGVTDVVLQETIAASIVDWRDKDDVERTGGAESEFYQSRPVAYSAKNGPFQRIAELLSVRGMTREILYGNVTDRERRAALQNAFPENREFAAGEYLGIAPYLTVHGTGKTDYATADREVLLAMDVPEDRIQEMLREREFEPEQSSANRPGSAVLRTAGSPRVYRLESVGRTAYSPITSKIVAVVLKEGTARAPRFRVIAWQEAGEY